MPQIGVTDVYTQSEGWIEIALYDVADFDFAPIEIYTPNGWGTPYLTDPADATTPIEVYTPQGWKGVNKLGILTVDGFEDGDMSEYDVPSSTGSVSVTGTAKRSGNYGLELVDFNILASLSGLDDYPGEGDEWEAYFYIPSGGTGGGQQYWFLCAVQNSGPNQSDIQNFYKFTMVLESDGDDTVEWEIDENGSVRDPDDTPQHQDTTAQIPENEWCRIHFHWDNSVSPSELHGQIFDSAGNAVSDDVWFTTDEKTWTGGGIGYRSSGVSGEVNEVHWDDINILPA